jgi:hypothetical protein
VGCLALPHRLMSGLRQAQWAARPAKWLTVSAVLLAVSHGSHYAVAAAPARRRSAGKSTVHKRYRSTKKQDPNDVKRLNSTQLAPLAANC